VETWASPYLAAQAEYLRHLGKAPVADVVEHDGIYAVRTGVFSNTENGVISSGASPVRPDVARDLIRWFGERRLPASWLSSEGEGRAATAAALQTLGCRPERAAWEMRASLDALELDVPVEVNIVQVTSEHELGRWLDVVGACDWFETETERAATADILHGLGFTQVAPLRLYVAFRGERVVGSASAFFAGEHVLLTAVAVLEDARRQGIGRSLAAARLREARERGCKAAVLAPSPDGAKLYGALGFRTYEQPADRWFYLPVSIGTLAEPGCPATPGLRSHP
jgi:GNAT superfamily N-acetyltransferase